MANPSPHHDGSALYVSTDAPLLGDTVRVRVRVPETYGPLRAVRTRSNPDHEPAWTDAEIVFSADGWDWWEAPITVVNPRHGYRFVFVHEDGQVQWLNQSGLHVGETLDSEDFALVATPAPPAWLHAAVMYQIFPDRFARSAAADDRPTPAWAIPAAWSDPVDPVMPGRTQQFYGGDLDGIIEHLDHLDDLGVNLVYLTPVFPAESNHRYDASTFDSVDPLLGGDDAYSRLIEAVHERGMKIIGDLTSNHSGDSHEWFRAAKGQPDAAEAGFYYFTDPECTTYESWLGYSTLPKFDWSNAELRRRFFEADDSVVSRWLQAPFGIDGWRVDVANMTGRLGAIDLNAEVRHGLLDAVRAAGDDRILLGESTNDAQSDLQGDAWHGAMTYPSFTRPVWGWLSEPTHEPYLTADGDTETEAWFYTQPIGGIPRYTAAEAVAAMTRFTAGIPWRVRLGNMQPLDTHDTARFATNASAEAVAVAVGLSMALPGVPVVFAGDEFALTGADGESSRTPIPWTEAERPDIAERRALYRDLIALRREHSVLATGGLRWLHVDDDAMVFVREAADESILVLATRGAVAIDLDSHVLSGAEEAHPLWGEALLAFTHDDGVQLEASGTSFTAWSLPGLRVDGATS